MDVTAGPSHTTRDPSPWIVLVAASYALAALDLALLITLSEPASLTSSWVPARALLRSFVVLLVLYAVAGTVAVLPVRLLGRSPTPLSTSSRTPRLAAALVAGSLPCVLARVYAIQEPRLASWILLGGLVAALPAALGAYRLAASWRGPGSSRRWTAASLIAAALSAELLLCLWWATYGDGSPGPGWIVTGGLILAAGTVLLLARRATPRWGLAWLGILISAPILVGFAPTRRPGMDSAKDTTGPRRTPGPILLLTLDTLRRDALSCYDPAIDSGPHIASLARESVLFRQAHSTAPWTLPSVVSILTGLSPGVHRVGAGRGRLPASIPTLADHFRDAGYVTAAVGVNGVLAENVSLRERFGSYRFDRHRQPKTLGWTVARAVFPDLDADLVTTAEVARRAIRILEARRRQNLFLWVHFLDPHDPYRPPPAFAAAGRPAPRIGRAFDIPGSEVLAGRARYSPAEVAWMRELYQAEVRYVDHHVGEILATLRELELFDDSLIVLTSDHGEEFWEHGGLDHGHTLYNELLEIPLLVKLPGGEAAGQVVEDVVTTEDLLPTILEIAGLDFRGDRLSGRSSRPLWTGGAPPAPGAVVSSGLLRHREPRQRMAVTFQGLKYVSYVDRAHDELFDLASDPREQTDLAARRPADIERLRRILRRRVREHRALQEMLARSPPEQNVDERLERELRSLGYLP